MNAGQVSATEYMAANASFTTDSSRGGPRVLLAFVIVLAAGWTGGGRGAAAQNESVRNPHGNPGQCTSCHASATAGRRDLRFDGDVSQLCRSCHDGQAAAREAHPVNVVPSAAVAGRIPPGLPLTDGILTCVSCHDVSPDCRAGQPEEAPRYKLLREWYASRPLLLCLSCHGEKDYRPFNVHDQLEGGVAKTDTCAWCHAEVPDVNAYRLENASYPLRAGSDELCGNCHKVPGDHPLVSHLGAIPSAEFMWRMSAYEMQPQMRMSFAQLYRYASITRRTPRSIPLDENGRITCYTCHNPHEKGLLPSSNPRSLGAEPKKAVHHRVRAREGKVCVVCHEK